MSSILWLLAVSFYLENCSMLLPLFETNIQYQEFDTLYQLFNMLDTLYRIQYYVVSYPLFGIQYSIHNNSIKYPISNTQYPVSLSCSVFQYSVSSISIQ